MARARFYEKRRVFQFCQPDRENSREKQGIAHAYALKFITDVAESLVFVRPRGRWNDRIGWAVPVSGSTVCITVSVSVPVTRAATGTVSSVWSTWPERSGIVPLAWSIASGRHWRWITVAAVRIVVVLRFPLAIVVLDDDVRRAIGDVSVFVLFVGGPGSIFRGIPHDRVYSGSAARECCCHQLGSRIIFSGITIPTLYAATSLIIKDCRDPRPISPIDRLIGEF